MKQGELVEQLDTYFSIEAFDESAFLRARFTDSQFQTLSKFAGSSFVNGTWNGLMLDNTREVDRVYLVAFPSQSVLDTIIAREVARGAPGAMIFAHHLSDYEESDRGTVHIPETQLEELQEHQISYYHCHAPLDCHEEISTSTALANVLGLREQVRFAPYFGGRSAVHGVVGKATNFQTFASRLAKVTDVARLRYDQVRHNGRPVNHVAVAPGGADREILDEVARLGCDTLVTGHWWFFAENEDARAHRESMQELVRKLDMNLLGVSHYASEMVVMRDQLPGWFRDLGLEAEFVPQEDPWH